MNPYAILGSGLDIQEATALSTRLSAWHDAMVAHERRLRAGTASDACDDECPHAEAPGLWSEAVAAFGARAQELAFLRSRAQDTRRGVSTSPSPRARSEAAEYAAPASELRSEKTTRSSRSSVPTTAL